MTEQVAKNIVEAGDEVGLEIRLYENYNNRGYGPGNGRKTTGVVVPHMSEFTRAALLHAYHLGQSQDGQGLIVKHETAKPWCLKGGGV